MANKRENVNELAMEAVRAVASGNIEEIEAVNKRVLESMEEDLKELKEVYEKETDPDKKAEIKKAYEWMKKDFEALTDCIEEELDNEEEPDNDDMEDITDEMIDEMIDSAKKCEFKIVIENDKEGIAAHFEKTNFKSRSDVIISTSVAITYLIQKISSIEPSPEKRNILEETMLGLINSELGDPAIIIPKSAVKGVIKVTEEDEESEE